MARQIIDTTTNNGSYIGDPAKTAFEKTNANFLELYNLSVTFLPRTGGTISGGNFGAQPAGAGNDQVLIRTINTNQVTFDAVNSAASSFTPLSIRASSISFTGAINTSSTLNAASTITSTANGINSNGAGSGYTFLDRLDFAQTWAMFATGNECQIWNSVSGPALRISRAGAITAVSFNPTSSADVKDYIEGYTENASELLDRLVVITYKYRPEFIDSDDYVIGLLQENIKSVVPGASTDSKWVKDDVDSEDVERLIPGNYDIAQIMALNVRAHQEKNRRIKSLEDKLSDITKRLNQAGI